MLAAFPILEAQRDVSRIPGQHEVLVEIAHTSEGNHCFIYPFEGRLVHEGLATLLALRLGLKRRTTFALALNDSGMVLLTERPSPFVEALVPDLFSREQLIEDLIETLNIGQLGIRQFREIARVSGLILQKYPGAEQSSRQLQAGASLLWQVFNEF